MNTTLAVVLKAPRMFTRTSSEYRDFLAAELFCYAMIYLKNLLQAKYICQRACKMAGFQACKMAEVICLFSLICFAILLF